LRKVDIGIKFPPDEFQKLAALRGLLLVARWAFSDFLLCASGIPADQEAFWKTWLTLRVIVSALSPAIF
jgi:hypothetical protein